MSVFATFAIWQLAHCVAGARGIAIVGFRVMSESEESPPVRSSKLLAVLNGGIYPVEYTVEIPASGGLCSGAVWKGWITTRANSLMMTVPSGKTPFFKYASTFFLGYKRYGIQESLHCRR